MAKLDWRALKEEYVSGDTDSVSAFLEKKGIRRNGYVSRVTRGWNEFRWVYQDKLRLSRQQETIKQTSKVEADFNAKRLKIAHNLQLKALRALQHQEPRTTSQSVRMLEVGLREERDAAGINNKDKNPSLIQSESIYLKTRFAKELKKSLDNMSDEQFMGVVGNIISSE